MKLNTSLPGFTSSSLQKNGSTNASVDTGASGGDTTVTTTVTTTRNNVSMSPQLSQLMSIARDGSNDVNFSRVAEIRAGIQNGDITIDPSRIADGILDEARGLLATG